MPRIKNTRHITRNRKNKNFAIPAAAEAMPVNPNNAATSAIIRNITAQTQHTGYLLIEIRSRLFIRASYSFVGQPLRLPIYERQAMRLPYNPATISRTSPGP